ncbi:hypothetical protein CK203_111582 [Vitis vinifera]|uniref:Uncharacterized protein n=1 Tax=Vitis vinifera TaxID=29760 RepID=A0A438C8X1_VITVI|nr:hypothetical protein CK203_111582 [Vitis vinifera]
MDEENVNHLLIHCTVARVLWGIVLGLVGAQWVFPESVKEVIVSWKGDMVLFVEEQSLRKQALEEYKKWVIMEETYWRGNSMVKIKINGTWVTEKCDIKDGVVQVFHSFLSETEEWRPKCNELQVGVLGGEDVQCRFVKSINASFLVLIPKKEGTEDLKDFRSISLVGSFFKLLAKVLANRLKKKGEGGGRICKLDIEKTYDHVNWSFLLWLLERMGFGAKWISWIQWCIGTLLVEESEGGRIFVGWRFRGRGGVLLELASYVWFEVMSGLRVNLDKCELILVGRVENVEELTREFGCKFSMPPSSYLGLPLGARFKDVAVWDGVEERLRKRLSIWKRQYISNGGRLALIRSTLFSMPIFYKRKGGLGVRNLVLLNKALLRKWSWHFAVEREVLWRQVICGKYGEEVGGCSLVMRLDFGRTSGVETILCVFIFPPYLLFPWLRRLRWRMCGATLEGECGLLSSQGSLTIGRCSMWNVFS